VYHEGGIYTDVDSISVKGFDANFKKAFVGHAKEPYNDICSGVFGFPQKSNFLKYIIDCLREVRTYSYDYNSLDTKSRVCILTGPVFFTFCFKYYNDSSIQMINQELLTLGKDNPDTYTYHTYDSMWHDTNRLK
jgi:mannosyltransferase OCH1-like enzyme